MKINQKESYFEERDELNISKLRKLIRYELPDFCEEFFLGIEAYTSPLTRLGYAMDLKTFFQFLTCETREFGSLEIKEFTIADLDQVTSTHIEKYLHYLTYYHFNGKKLKNGEKAQESNVGAIVLLMSEHTPKVAPKIAPAKGPSTIAPIITGICTVVALIIGNWIIPSGVFASRIMIAIIRATLTVQRVSFLFVFVIFLFLLVIVPIRIQYGDGADMCQLLLYEVVLRIACRSQVINFPFPLKKGFYPE